MDQSAVNSSPAGPLSCFADSAPEHIHQHLNQRLRSNTAQEKLANSWLDHLLSKAGNLPRI